MPILVEKEGGGWRWNGACDSSRRVKAFAGNLACWFGRWRTFSPTARECGKPRKTRSDANYIRKHLEDVYELPYSLPSMHEVVFSDAIQKKSGVNTWTSQND